MEMKNCYRDITVKEMNEQHIGTTLRVAGWVENIRDHGGVSFVDLRDMYGVLQVVLRREGLLRGLTRETCISVLGMVENGMRIPIIPEFLPEPSSLMQERSGYWERCTSSCPLRS